jgi:hypothetical protein
MESTGQFESLRYFLKKTESRRIIYGAYTPSKIFKSDLKNDKQPRKPGNQKQSLAASVLLLLQIAWLSRLLVVFKITFEDL